MCYANVKLDNLPFLTCRLSLRFGHLLEVSSFDLGFLGVDAFVEGLLWPGLLMKMLVTFGGFVWAAPLQCFCFFSLFFPLFSIFSVCFSPSSVMCHWPLYL